MSSIAARIRQWIGGTPDASAREPTSETPAVTAWHSWDPAPWDHPFLTRNNLASMHGFSEALVADLARKLDARVPAARIDGLRFAFTGNMANNLYQRLRALAAHGTTPDLILHPQDTSLMSDPRWEEFDGAVPEGTDVLDEAVLEQGTVGAVTGGVRRPGQVSDWPNRLAELRGTYRPEDLDRWPEFFCLLPMLVCLREYDAVYGAQFPFVPYLANKPFLLSQSGSDIRVAASRGDRYGALHRVAYHHCAAFLASNPWSIAHARRLGMRNMILLPTMIDETIYQPGPPIYREEWRGRVGGDFFVLSTARLNDEIKGSSISLKGFAKFAANTPDARLVIIEWGQEKDLARRLLAEFGLLEKTVFLPLSGKRRLISYLRSADCLLDQVVMKQLGSTAREALACGVPVVMGANAAHYDAYFTGSLPVLNVSVEADIAAALEKLHRDADLRGATAAASRRWFLDNLSGKRWAESYRVVLSACALGLDFSFADSPLAVPLDETELDYHRQGLASAPVHP